MSYEIELCAKVKKILKKLPKDISLRIIKKLQVLKEEPFHYLEHFEGKKLYKFRVGDYRILVDAEITEKVLLVQMLDKRGRVYKR